MIELSLHGIPVRVVSRDRRFMEFFNEYRRSFSFREGLSSKQGVITLNFNNRPQFSPEGFRKKTEDYRYFSVRCWRFGKDVLLGDGLSMGVIKADEGIAWCHISRRALKPSLFNAFFTILLVELMRPFGFFFLHSACVADKRERGIIICGWPRTGKTTLTIGFLRKGFCYLSDDAILLRSRMGYIMALSLRKGFHIYPESKPMFPEAKGLHLRGFKELFFPDSSFPKSYLPRCSPKLILFPVISRRKKTDIIPLTQSDAFIRLIQQSFHAFFERDVGKRHSQALKSLIAQSRSYELKAGRDLKEMPERIVDIISGIM